MTIQLTDQQWADIQQEPRGPVRVSDPARQDRFVLVRSDIYDRFKSLFESDPVGEQERLEQLRQFGQRAVWNDPEMDIYNDLDPRRSK
jgi:hypothetical protein